MHCFDYIHEDALESLFSVISGSRVFGYRKGIEYLFICIEETVATDWFYVFKMDCAFDSSLRVRMM